MEQQKRLAKSMLQMRVDRSAFATSGSLKKLTQLCILKNKEFFYDLVCTQEEEDDDNPFLAISNTMKNELIELDIKMQAKAHEDRENLEDDIVLQWTMVLMLLNEEMTSFQFPADLNLDTGLSPSDLWQRLLAMQPHDLHTIVCKCKKYKCWDVRPFFDSLLPRFPNLEVLQLANFSCTDQDLHNIVERLTKLRVLEVGNLEGVSNEGILALRKLNSLEEFLFDVKGSFNMPEVMAIKQCFELLHHLQAICYKPTPRTFLCKSLNIFIGVALSKIEKPCTLQLRQLALTNIDHITVHILMPELQKLFLSGPIYEMHPLFAGGLPKLTEFYMNETDEETLALVLRHVGQQLRTLQFAILDGESQLFGNGVRLDTVFDMCPNLSELDVSTSLSPRTVSRLKPDTLQRLQKLKFYFSYADDMESGLFLQFVSLAPELQSIDLSSVSLDDKELKKWAELAKGGTCMQNLKKVRMSIDTRHFKQKGKSLLDKALIACSINCPQMQEYEIHYYPNRC